MIYIYNSETVITRREKRQRSHPDVSNCEASLWMPPDMESITGSLVLLCLISLANANSRPVINPLVYRVCEDVPIGGTAFTIAATDPENDPLTYTLSGPNSIYFAVNSATGIVTVNRPLDRETDDLIIVDVTVSDGLNNANAQLNIILLDANDNRPIFEEASYDVEIPENTAVGTSLFRATATDADTSLAGVITYSIDQVTPSAGLTLFTIDTSTGVVTLNGRLNYATLGNSYRLKINATDGGGKCFLPETNYHSNVVFSIVTVVDVPDMDPRFTNVPYIGNVDENSPEGQSVLQVTAIDQDTGVDDTIIYSIEDSTAEGLFAISSETGTISVLSQIDRETVGDIVTLTVKATESNPDITGIKASATTTVQININDVNDNKPQFYRCEGPEAPVTSCVVASTFTGEVFEHSSGFISINMTVEDLDKNTHTELILEGTYKDVFSVEPQRTVSRSAVQLLVREPEMLDFEKIKQMTVQVIAIDQDETSFRSTATVTINIKDTNDNIPEFPKETYKLNVSEHSEVGTIVANITAEDPDTMDQGKITYALVPESILPYFDVKPNSGEIYVKNQNLLDRESRSLYTATLQARDTDNKIGTTLLEITLTDINDNSPVFNRDSYQFFVKEGGQLKETIQATDADDPDSENSQIVYGIMPGKYSDNFTIDPNTGVLMNSGELDREALNPDLNGRVELNVTATDKGTPSQSSWVTVIINIEDINDNIPQFINSVYKFSVKEAEKGAYVGSVYAEDLDRSAEFNRISFSIDGSFGLFTIRTSAEDMVYKGNITVDRDIELNYEGGNKQFTLLVEATDLDQQSSTVTVEVEVLDVNDERPEFKPSAPVAVKENTTISEVIGKFLGDDKDGNHSLVYELESMKCRCNSSLIDCNWFVLDSTGEVTVNPEITVDYEQCDQAVIEAWVLDVYTEKGPNKSISTGQMEINIVDINDNAPEFIPSNSVFVVVSEGASKGTAVAKVTATDRDSGINSQIDFKVTEVKFVHSSGQTTDMRMLFEAVTTQQKDIYVGIIQTTEKLELSLKGKYLVTVTATDTGGLYRSTVLDIFTVDESYKVELQFRKTVEEVENTRGEISRALTAATQAAVEIVSIRSDSQVIRNPDVTIMVAYFVYSNGTALTSVEVEKMLSVPDHYFALTDLGLIYIGKPPSTETKIDTVKYALLGIVGGLIIVLAVLTISLMCSRRNYKRKLKASKAMNSATNMASDNQKGGAVVPGTNKYTMEGANPVLNLNIDAAMVLDEESTDVDKVSLNSLDYSDDMNNSEKDKPYFMKMIQEEEEEDNNSPEYIEPLGAALAQRGKKNDKPSVGFSNPAFNTTDL